MTNSSENPKAAPPPNPFYKRHYVCSLEHGDASLEFTAPGGKLSPQDASDLVEFLELVCRQIKKCAVQPDPATAAIAAQEEA